MPKKYQDGLKPDYSENIAAMFGELYAEQERDRKQRQEQLMLDADYCDFIKHPGYKLLIESEKNATTESERDEVRRRIAILAKTFNLPKPAENYLNPATWRVKSLADLEARLNRVLDFNENLRLSIPKTPLYWQSKTAERSAGPRALFQLMKSMGLKKAPFLKKDFPHNKGEIPTEITFDEQMAVYYGFLGLIREAAFALASARELPNRPPRKQ